MSTRRIGADWFDSAVSFDEFINAPHAYYSIDGGADQDLGEISTVETYQSDPHPVTEETVTLYRGTFNDVIPAGAEGSSVVLKIYDPVHPDLALEYDPIDVCTDVATSIVINPATASVQVGRTRSFSVTAYAADSLPTDNYEAVVWSVDGGGEINEDTGVFTAGDTPGGPHGVTATSGTLEDTAEVTVVQANNIKGFIHTLTSTMI